MPSFRSKLLVFILKNRHFLKGKLKRTDSISDRTDIPKLRQEVEHGADFFGKLPKGFSLEPIKVDDLQVEWMLPKGANRDRAILYFHGGGLVVGSIRSHRGIVAKFVKGTGVAALLFEYRLAPEHPFPAGLDDSITAYQYLLDQSIKPNKIIFMGDSGGGNLVFATLLAAKEKGMPMPGGAVALSPWTDLTNSGASWTTNAAADTLCWKEAQTVFSKMYCDQNNPKDPLISPLFGNPEGFPSMLLFAGGDETMRDDSTRLATKAEEAGVDVCLTVGEGLFHCYPALSPAFPEAKKAFDEICEFIRDKTK